METTAITSDWWGFEVLVWSLLSNVVILVEAGCFWILDVLPGAADSFDESPKAFTQTHSQIFVLLLVLLTAASEYFWNVWGGWAFSHIVYIFGLRTFYFSYKLLPFDQSFGQIEEKTKQNDPQTGF